MSDYEKGFNDAVAKAVVICNEAREDGECDIRSVRDRIDSLKIKQV